MRIAELSSVLLIGKNGAGKSTVVVALEVLQRIAKGTQRVGDLVKPKDLSQGRAEVPMRFEIEVEIEGNLYTYSAAFEFPDGFKELRVFDEKLLLNNTPVYSREKAEVRLARSGMEKEAVFNIDWHIVALPIIQQRSGDPVSVLKRWLASMLILRPVPGLITGTSEKETLQPAVNLGNFGDWFSGIIADAPSAYSTIDKYLKQVMPDLKDIRNREVGVDSRSLTVQFSRKQEIVNIPFGDLSDGEKCFMIGALVLAANTAHGPVFCFWDEPDNYLAMSEVGHFVMALRRGFQSAGGQFIATSHDPEAIRSFSYENTLLLYRKNHLEPTLVRPLNELEIEGDLVGALVRDDLEP